MKKYVKPSLEFVELRIEERLARCYYEPNPGKGKGKCDQSTFPHNHSSDLPGNHPGCHFHCPHS